jgi:hypothetical protein
MPCSVHYPNMSATAPHKLAHRSTHCVFLGYSEHHKGYRCLNLSTNHLVISRHVVFDEAVFPYATSPHRATNLQFLLSETAPVVSPIGTCLPAGSTAPRAATLEPSLTDAAGQATPLASGHPPLVSRAGTLLWCPGALTPLSRPSSHRLLCHARLLHQLLAPLPGPRGLTNLSVIAPLHGQSSQTPLLLALKTLWSGLTGLSARSTNVIDVG